MSSREAELAIPELTVAMPAFNEASNLEFVVDGITASLRGAVSAYEILVVDDGSADRTLEVANGIAFRDHHVRVLRHDRNLGFSAAWWSCVRGSRGRWVFLGPADGQFTAGTPLDLYRARADSDVVIGVRRTTYQRGLRRLISVTFQTMARAAFDLPFRDFSLCLLFRGDLVRGLRPLSRPRSATILPELLFLARRRQATVTEMPVDFLARRSGAAKGTSLGLAALSAWEILRLAAIYRLTTVGRHRQ